MALTARTHDAPLLLFDVFFLLISCVQVCTLQWVVNSFRPIYHDALFLTNLFKDQLLEADTYLIANKHVLNRINSIDYGEITMDQIGRYNSGSENLHLKHLPWEREERNVCK